MRIRSDGGTRLKGRNRRAEVEYVAQQRRDCGLNARSEHTYQYVCRSMRVGMEEPESDQELSMRFSPFSRLSDKICGAVKLFKRSMGPPQRGQRQRARRGKSQAEPCQESRDAEPSQ